MSWREMVLVAALVVMGILYAYERDNRDGFIIERVIGVSALCRDGMYSTSKRDNGTCSKHGGVKRWVIEGE